MTELVAAAREAKDKGTFGYVDTPLPSAELARIHSRVGGRPHATAPPPGCHLLLIATASRDAMFLVMTGALATANVQ